MSKNIAEKAAFRFYNLAWGLAIPFLRRNRRLAEGFRQRTLRDKVPEKADVWIQAASAGESYLAWSLLKSLEPAYPIRVLLTSNTSQGFEILERAVCDVASDGNMTAHAAYFPFDKPAIMEVAVRSIQPKVMVLLELEIWPGLLSALKRHDSKILIINGRITPKSLRRYLAWPSLWRSLKPDKVLAISENDAERFASLFGKEQVEVMPNIKFDRIGDPAAHAENPLRKMFPPDMSLTVLGSTRREEEPLIEKIISDIHRRNPQGVIALFPRHIHRVKHWESALTQLAIPWALRSRAEGAVSPGTLILWDTFGELSLAYGLSKAVYVGGGLAPLGGQNFLEPLTCGIIPVIGPSWENFAWVGQEIVDQGLVRVAADWKEVADILTETIENPKPYEKVCEATLRYVKDRQGGTYLACCLINSFLPRPGCFEVTDL